MIYIDTTDLQIADNVLINNVLNQPEQYQVISFPEESLMRGNLMKCIVRKHNSKIEKTIYFNK